MNIYSTPWIQTNFSTFNYFNLKAWGLDVYFSIIWCCTDYAIIDLTTLSLCMKFVLLYQKKSVGKKHINTTFIYTPFCRTNADIRIPLRRLADTYNKYFSPFDIFSTSNNLFEGHAITLCNISAYTSSHTVHMSEATS